VGSIFDKNIRLGGIRSGLPTIVPNVLPHSRTTRVERFLLLTTIIILPLETHIPTVAGFSALFLMFAVLAGYVIVARPHVVVRIWRHPVFIAAYAFLAISGLLEFTSPLPMYEAVFRFGLMIVGAIVVASLCRDRLALGACLYGYIGAGLWLAVILFLSSYGALRGVTATDFNEASRIRAEVFRAKAVRGNINAMSFACLQGGIVAFAYTIASGSPRRRKLSLGIAVFCVSASLLTMSRAAAAISILACLAVLYAHGVRHAKALVVAGVLAGCIFLLVPDAIWSRMTVHTGEGIEDVRLALYRKALQALPEYVISGVGAGNFLNKWGFENGFGAGDRVYSLHNMFLQVMVYWGLMGLLPFIVLTWQAYRCLPEQCGREVLSLGLVGIAVSHFIMMSFYTDFYSKGLSLVLGMLVASRCWPGQVTFFHRMATPQLFS